VEIVEGCGVDLAVHEAEVIAAVEVVVHEVSHCVLLLSVVSHSPSISFLCNYYATQAAITIADSSDRRPR
jgi:hypothetical protein